MKQIFGGLAIVATLTSCGDFKQSQMTQGASGGGISALEEISTTGDLSVINKGTFSVEKMILNNGYFIAQSGHEQLLDQLKDLHQDVELLCLSATGSDTEAGNQKFLEIKEKVKESWKKSVSTWHQLEAFKYGPIAKDGEASALRIYSWPLNNHCRVDLEIAKISENQNYQLKNNVALRSLSTVEGIIFTKDGEHNCPAEPDFLKNWKNKKIVDRRVDQCRYLKLLTGDLKIEAKKVHDEWRIDVGNYPVKILRDQVLGKKVDAVNSLSQSLFFIEKITKDIKLGAPTGIIGCAREYCPEMIEHALSKTSLEAIHANLLGFKKVFNGQNFQTGKEGFGFDDYLVSEGYGEVARKMNQSLDLAIVNFEKAMKISDLEKLLKDFKKEECNESTSDNRKNEACALFQDIRGLTNLLKNDFLLALRTLQAPANSQGDMD